MEKAWKGSLNLFFMTNPLTYRLAIPEDSRLYFYWANDDAVRRNSFSPGKIEWETHEKWFREKLASDSAYMLVFFAGANAVGQLRLDRVGGNLLEVDLSVDKEWRGKKIGRKIMAALKDIRNKFFPSIPIKGVIQKQNIASIRAFEAAGFEKKEEMLMQEIPCDVLYLH